MQPIIRERKTELAELCRRFHVRRLDLFEGHSLKTDGAFAFVRHPMYLGIVTFHLGASLALESLPLLILTALVVVPLTLTRIAAEESVLRAAFAPYSDYARRVPALVPIALLFAASPG